MLVHCCGWSWAIVTLGDWKDMKPQPPIYHYLNYIIVFSKYRQRLYIQYKYYMVSLHVFQDPNSMSISWCCRMGKISTIFRTRYDFSEWHMLLWWVLMVYVSMFACDPVPGLRQIISKYKSLRIVWGNWSLVKMIPHNSPTLWQSWYFKIFQLPETCRGRAERREFISLQDRWLWIFPNVTLP